MRDDGVRLADEPPFVLGRTRFDPPTRQMIVDGASQTVEPRVMQVLVALAQAGGAVVSRDELIARCWDGRIVGEAAINRVISILRQLASTGGFALETVTKVGYRLITEDGSDETPVLRIGDVEANPVSRRVVIAAGGATLAVAGAGIGGWMLLHPQQEALPPEAQVLLAKGRETLNQVSSESDRQALAYLKEASERAPRSADVLGSLAIAYVHNIDFEPPAAYRAGVGWVTATARRALALDRTNGDAEAALVACKPWFRRWAAFERECRTALSRHPDNAELNRLLGGCLTDVGRWNEAVEVHGHAARRDPYNQNAVIARAFALWGARRLPEAEEAFQNAARLWPGFSLIYAARFNFAVIAGQPAVALAIASDERGRPSGRMFMPIELGMQVARALAGRDRTAMIEAVRAVAAARDDHKIFSITATAYLAALGAATEAFDTVVSFLGGRDPLWRPGARHRWPLQSETDVLFGNPMPTLRRDPRYSALLNDLGLEAYWRETGTLPHFRR